MYAHESHYNTPISICKHWDQGLFYTRYNIYVHYSLCGMIFEYNILYEV